MTNPLFTQVTFRLRNDNGSETTATWVAAEGADATLVTDTNYRIRFRIDETNGRSWSNKTWNLYYSKNAGAYTAVASGQPVKLSLSSNFTQGDDCTTQLTGGTGTFVTDNNGMCESSGATNSGSAGYLFEVEYCFQIDSAYVAQGDTINLRVYDSSTAINAYTDTPVITVNEPTTVTLTKATLTATPRAVTMSLGAVTSTMSRGILTSNPRAITVSLTTTVSLNKAALASTPRSITIIAAAGIIVDIDHEGGTLGEYTSTVTDSGDLSVTAAAKLAGTNYGLSCLVDDTTSIYGFYDLGSPNTTGVIRLRIYLDPNNISMSNTYEMDPINLQNSSWNNIFQLMFYYNSGYQIAARAYNDSGNSETSKYTITDEPHYIEVYIKRATTTSSNDGVVTLWIDGTQKETITNLDNNTSFANFQYFYAGPLNITSGISGTFFLDQFIVRDDNTEIGALPTTVTVSKATLTSTPNAISTPITEIVTKGTLTTVPRNITISADVSITLNKASISSTAQSSIAVPGNVTVPLSLATITASAKSISLSLGAVTSILSNSTLTLNARTVVASEAFTISLNKANLNSIPNSITLSLGAVTSILSVSSLTSTGRSITEVPGAVAVSVSTSSLVSSVYLARAMGIYYNVNFETGDTSQFSYFSNGEGGSVVNSEAALKGSYGLKILDTTQTPIGYNIYLSGSGKARVRFYIDLNNSSFSNNDYVYLASVENPSTEMFQLLVRLDQVGGQTGIRAYSYDDTFSEIYTSSDEWLYIGSGKHYIEAFVSRATSSTAQDGELKICVDNSTYVGFSNIDNYDTFSILGTTIFGIINSSLTDYINVHPYLDEYIYNDTGEYIGPSPEINKASLVASAQSIVASTPVTINLNTASLTLTSQKVIHVGRLVNINIESGTLNEFDYIHSDMSISINAALANSTYGIEIPVSGKDYIYSYKNIYSDTNKIRVRFYFDVNSISAIGTKTADVLLLETSEETGLLYSFIRKDVVGYSIGASYRTDSGLSSNYTTITDNPHWIEIYYIRATTSSSSDGYLDWWVDEVQQDSIISLDNYDTFTPITKCYFGYDAVSSGDFTGTLFLDELVVNNSGEYIGPANWLDKTQLITSPRSITITTGAVTVPLSASSITSVARTISTSEAFTISISKANLNSTPNNISLSLGGVSTSLSKATLVSTPQSTVAKEAYTISFSKADLISIPRNISLSLGEVSTSLSTSLLNTSPRSISITSDTLVNLSVAQLTFTPRSITHTLGAVTVSTNTAQLIASPKTASATVGGTPVNITFSVASLTSTARSIILSPGAVSNILSTLSLTTSAKIVSVTAHSQANLSTSTLVTTPRNINISAESYITLSTAQLNSNPRSVTNLLGAVTISVSTSTITTAPKAVSTSVGAVYVDVNRSQLSSVPRNISFSMGGVTTQFSVSSLTAVARSTTVSSIVGTNVNVNNASIISTPRSISISVGTSTVSLGKASLVIIPRTITVIPGSYSYTIDNASLITTARSISSVPGTAIVPVNKSEITSNAYPNTVIPGSTSAILDRAILNILARSLLEVVDQTISLSEANIISDAQSIITQCILLVGLTTIHIPVTMIDTTSTNVRMIDRISTTTKIRERQLITTKM